MRAACPTYLISFLFDQFINVLWRVQIMKQTEIVTTLLG